MIPLKKAVLKPSLYVVKPDSGKNPSIIYNEIGKDALSYIANYADLNNEHTFVASTINSFNIANAPLGKYETIINLLRVNDIKDINKFFDVINTKLTCNGTFIACAETERLRYNRLLKKFIFPINYIYTFSDYLFKRVFPKLPITRRIYFFVTGGRNRVVSRIELLGRFYRAGFEILDEQGIGSLKYFIVRKTKKPPIDDHKSHSPIIRLKRVGKNGKLVNIYKLRTMYSYSEYLQEYVYKLNNVDTSGKFKNDFRISPGGKILRKLWLDELPMLINLFKGDVKLFGVRPLSTHYYNLYTDELKKERIKYKPGLVPPYYVDLPKSMEEIMASEMKYLKLYGKKPLKTDIKYLFIAFYNIVIKGSRSS